MSAVWAMNQLEQLKEQLASAQATCAKLHDLNHMQAQRIDTLEARLKSAGTSLCDTRNFDAMSDALNTALMQAETRAKRCYELEQELMASYDENRTLRAENTRLIMEHEL